MNNLIHHKNTLYVIKRRIPVHNIDPKLERLKLWKEYLNIDHVLRKGNYFLLCEEVKEAQIISETIK